MAKTVAEKRTESKPVIAVNETEIKVSSGSWCGSRWKRR